MVASRICKLRLPAINPISVQRNNCSSQHSTLSAQHALCCSAEGTSDLKQTKNSRWATVIAFFLLVLGAKWILGGSNAFWRSLEISLPYRCQSLLYLSSLANFLLLKASWKHSMVYHNSLERRLHGGVINREHARMRLMLTPSLVLGICYIGGVEGITMSKVARAMRKGGYSKHTSVR